MPQQSFNAVTEVLRDGLTVIGVADRTTPAAKPSTAGYATTPPAGGADVPTVRTNCLAHTYRTYVESITEGTGGEGALPGSVRVERVLALRRYGASDPRIRITYGVSAK